MCLYNYTELHFLEVAQAHYRCYLNAFKCRLSCWPEFKIVYISMQYVHYFRIGLITFGLPGAWECIN